MPPYTRVAAFKFCYNVSSHGRISQAVCDLYRHCSSQTATAGYPEGLPAVAGRSGGNLLRQLRRRPIKQELSGASRADIRYARKTKDRSGPASSGSAPRALEL